MLTIVPLLAFLFAWLVPSSVLTAESNPAANSPSPLPGVSLVGGQQVPFFHHQPIATLRVYAFHDDIAIPIPFQIDERDRRDRWVLDQGPRPNSDNSAGEFDSNDVIVLMNRDLGLRGDPAKLPNGATVWGEIRVGSEVNPLGFAYVGSFNSPPPLPDNEHAYAHYDPETDRVYAERYALEFHAPLPRHVAFVNQFGAFGENTVAGVHAIGEVRFLGGLFTLRRTDTDVQSELLSYRNGPVRAIRRARYWIPLSFGFRTNGRVDLLFYRDFVEGTALVKLKIPPSLVLADGELQAYFDFLHFSGARLLSENGQLSEPVNRQTIPAKHAFDGRLAHWAALLLPDGRTVLLVVRLEGALQKLEQRLFIHEAPEARQKAGGQPLFGFQFSRVSQLATGTHRLSVFAAVLDGIAVEDIPRAAQIFLSPPEVNVALLGNL